MYGRQLTTMLNYAINNEAIQGCDPIPLLINNLIYKGYDAMTKSRVANPVRICQVDGCGKKHKAKGYCGTHYMQLLTRGKILEHTRDNEIKIKGNDCFIQLYNRGGGKVAVTVVDADDFELVNKKKWCLAHGKYVCTTVNGKKTYLSRHLMNPEDRVEIDHKDRDPLNNRRSNLRFATSSQNSANCVRPTSSGFCGVYWNKDNSNWRSRVQYEGRVYEVGSFLNKEDAALAYNKKALEIFGEFARLNDI